MRTFFFYICLRDILDLVKINICENVSCTKKSRFRKYLRFFVLIKIHNSRKCSQPADV